MNNTEPTTEQCFCKSYSDDNLVVQDCTCGKCGRAYTADEFSKIVIRNSEGGRKIMATTEDWYNLAKAYQEALGIMKQNNCVAVSHSQDSE